MNKVSKFKKPTSTNSVGEDSRLAEVPITVVVFTATFPSQQLEASSPPILNKSKSPLALAHSLFKKPPLRPEILAAVVLSVPPILKKLWVSNNV